jgi:ribonuclease HII
MRRSTRATSRVSAAAKQVAASKRAPKRARSTSTPKEPPTAVPVCCTTLLGCGDGGVRSRVVSSASGSNLAEGWEAVAEWLRSDPAPESPASEALPATLDLSFEERAWKAGLEVVGVDEAGRGPLAGPVVAAAVSVVGPSSVDRAPVLGVNDSKAISEAERDSLAEQLMSHPRIRWAIVATGVHSIEEFNILRAALDSMTAAADAVLSLSAGSWEMSRVRVLIDGNRMPPAFLPRPKRSEADGPSFEAETIVKGDAKCYSIAAASILAKVARDKMMVHLGARYPEYDLATHKGYPTPQHMALVKAIGPSPIHRLTFAPLKGVWTRSKTGEPVRVE